MRSRQAVGVGRQKGGTIFSTLKRRRRRHGAWQDKFDRMKHTDIKFQEEVPDASHLQKTVYSQRRYFCFG